MVNSALALAVSSGDEECVRMLAKGSNKRNREMAKLIARRMGAMALEEAIDSPKRSSLNKFKPGGTFSDAGGSEDMDWIQAYCLAMLAKEGGLAAGARLADMEQAGRDAAKGVMVERLA